MCYKIKGVTLKSKNQAHQDQVQVAPFTLLPTPFPKTEFEKAVELQTIFNELMHKVAYDREFITEKLKRYYILNIKITSLHALF